MIKEIKINKKIIGKNKPVFIIAEAGVNHNGSLETALRLVDAAATSGADAVKFQTFRAEDVVTKEGKMVGYQVKNMGKSISQLEMIKGFELNESFWSPIISHCKEKNIIFLSTPHGGFHSVDLLHSLNVPAFKIGSGDLTNLPVLSYAARFKKPMILGTGMATMAEVNKAIDCVKETGNSQIVVLHCTTNYPCPFNEVNLEAMKTMMNKINVLVGYSDHTTGIQVPIMAASLGACVIEKHFTLDKNMSGPDHIASLEPDELKKMVDSIRNVSKIMGSGVKRPNASEVSMIKTVRKSVVAIADIKKGEIYSLQNLAIKRPGTGISPIHFYEIIGRVAKKDIKNDSLIQRDDY